MGFKKKARIAREQAAAEKAQKKKAQKEGEEE